jgi:hypothetical protein
MARSRKERSRLTVFVYELACLIALLVVAVVYLWRVIEPKTLGTMPIAVPWFGAVGAVVISLSGVFRYPGERWRPELEYWHYSRPVIGATLGVVGVLIFQAGILAVGSDPTPSDESASDLLYYVIAFVIGYREETFRELIRRVADVLLTPEGRTRSSVDGLTPSEGPASGEIVVAISGSGLEGATAVRFGAAAGEILPGGSDSLLLVKVPPASQPGKVPVVVDTADGSSAIFEFTYT